MYNYMNLDSKEFEELACDVVNRRDNLKLRTYATGRDQGIDGYYSDDDIVLQAKYFVNSTTSQLKGRLRDEVTKVQRLNPQKYYVVVAKELSKVDVDEIKDMFGQYIVRDEQILDLNSIDSFLRKPENYDLLIKYSRLVNVDGNTLNALLQGDLFADTMTLKEDIEKESVWFADTDFFYQCMKMISKERIVLLVGDPGVGKTINSHMILRDFLAIGCKVTFSSGNDIQELKKAIVSRLDVREVVFIDDFLGQRYCKLDEINIKEIISLIKLVLNCRNKYLVINSRITVLNAAKDEDLELCNLLEDDKVSVTLIDFNQIGELDKAKVLCKILFNNNVPVEYLNAVCRERGYYSILRHSNYNPRIIAEMTRKKCYEGINSSEYLKNILMALDNPREIWADEYRNRLSKEDRLFLACLYSLTDTDICIDVMAKCFNHYIPYLAVDFTNDVFAATLERLTDSMVRQSYRNGKLYLGVLNPSVNDFLDGELKNNHVMIKRLKDHLFSFEQIKRICAKDEIDEVLHELVRTKKILQLHFLSEKERTLVIVAEVLNLNIQDNAFQEVFDLFYEKYYCNSIHIVINRYVVVSCNVLWFWCDKELARFYKYVNNVYSEKFIRNAIDNNCLTDIVNLLNTLCKVADNNERIVELCQYEINDEFRSKVVEYVEGNTDVILDKANEYVIENDDGELVVNEEEAVSACAEYMCGDVDVIVGGLDSDLYVSDDFYSDIENVCVDAIASTRWSYCLGETISSINAGNRQEVENKIDEMFKIELEKYVNSIK